MKTNCFWRISLLFFFLSNTGYLSLAQSARYTLSGYVKEIGSSELLAGASIAIPSLKTGTVSNNYGFYSMTLPAGEYEILVTYIGYAPKAFKVKLAENVTLDIILSQQTQLKELVVESDKQTMRLADETRMSVVEIPVHQIREIPALLGEKDVLKVIQLLPGVQKGSEGNAGIYVRGGGPDQNLLILDDATVYNAFHLFGFFSLFNGDALKSVELTKGGFPARYGGRLSSVIDMRMKDGDKEKVRGEAGIGFVASRVLVEGPLIKGKSSFVISGRRTYIDQLLMPMVRASSDGARAGYYFYDFNVKANYELNQNNKLYLSGYFGRDKFYSAYEPSNNESAEAGLYWGNATATLRWNHLFHPKLFANTSLIFSKYTFAVYSYVTDFYDKFTLDYSSGINDFGVKQDFDFRPNTNHTIKAGAQILYHEFIPSAMVIKNNISNINLDERRVVTAFENAVYGEDEIKLGTRVRLNPGLRISNFMVQGQQYFKAEPRFNAMYKIRSDLSAKASYAMMNQYIHLLSNTGLGLPTDLWVPTTKNIKPENCWQVAGGLAKDYTDKNFSVTLEGYYKHSSNILSYKEGASFLDAGFGMVNSTDLNVWERNITFGQAWSYGAELLVQRKTGRLTGWIGYTLSWTQMQFDEINFGNKFWARYDRRHDVSVVGIYSIQEMKRGQSGLVLSGTWVYGTGNAITLPISEYDAPYHVPGNKNLLGNSGTVTEYTSWNGFRMGAYHRFDLSFQVTRQVRYWIRTWEFSVYNLYNRANPYFYYIGYGNSGNRALYQMSLFPLIPSISWNIKF